IGLGFAREKGCRRGGDGLIGDNGDVFVGQGRVDEWIVPGIVAANEAAEDGGEFSNLEIYPWLVEGRVAQEIFVKAGVAVGTGAGIDAAIDAKLDEAVKMFAELRVEHERQAGLNQRIVI